MSRTTRRAYAVKLSPSGQVLWTGSSATLIIFEPPLFAGNAEPPNVILYLPERPTPRPGA